MNPFLPTAPFGGAVPYMVRINQKMKLSITTAGLMAALALAPLAPALAMPGDIGSTDTPPNDNYQELPRRLEPDRGRLGLLQRQPEALLALDS